MMSHSAAPQSNAKRYWGDEKNIDSIYSIYIKKICYTYSNDAAIYANTNGDTLSSASSSATPSRKGISIDDKTRHRISTSANPKHSASINDVAELESHPRQQVVNYQKEEIAPRSRKNFFQKYRRRSCSVDKYTFEKAYKGADSSMTATLSGKTKSGHRYGLTPSSGKKKINEQHEAHEVSYNADELDGYATTKSSNNDSSTQVRHSTKEHTDVDRSNSCSSKSSSTKLNLSAHKSMNDISMQAQSLLWETRQIKILQAATLDHVLKFILLINTSQSIKENQQNLSNNISRSASPALVSNSTNSSTGDDSSLDEERNNVAHIIHVFFCTYRIYTNPYELLLKLMDYSDFCRIEQYRFVMYYWMDNYPEDFDYIVEHPENQATSETSSYKNHRREPSNNSLGGNTNPSINSYNNSIASYDSSATGRTNATNSDSETNVAAGEAALAVIDGDSSVVAGARTNTTASISSRVSSAPDEFVEERLNRRLSNLSIRTTNSGSNNNSSNIRDINQNDNSGVPLVSELLRLTRDEFIRKRAMKLNELRRGPLSTSGSLDSTGSETVGRHRSSSSRHNHHHHHHHHKSKNSAVLDLDSRYVAQQLTAIDLENFLNLRPYALLDGSKSDKRIQSMIKNFNLLSRHVVVTILKSHNPNIVAAHWIAIAMNLRKTKNFNSLKAIIAGLTNESIYRLKQLIWNKIDRISLANFKLLASIVDDVNNQIVLRQTQLIVEGTAKMSIEDDSFGTIPYLGTFLTDLNMIDARYQSYVPSPKDETCKLKLINFEKCAKQFEILTQLQLLQKNVLASLHAIQRRNNFDEQTTLNRLKLEQFNQSNQMLSAKPVIPKVSRLFENWFFDDNVAAMTDKQCYEISVALEQNVVHR